MTRQVQITERISVGEACPLLVIAGPCQIESYDHCMKILSYLQKSCLKHKINLVFKSSYDKANRTSVKGLRGPGIEDGLRILQKVRESSGVPVITDVHSPEEAKMAGEVADIIQTPAFLCRQTDLLLAAGRTFKPVNIKKGQFLPPADMKHAAEKVESTGNSRIMLCERGSCFGYRDLVVDMRGLVIMRESGYPVIFDATHSVQSMGGKDGHSGGQRDFVEPLALSAIAAGADGIFIECHENPDSAPSDAASMMLLEAVPLLVEKACRIKDALAK